MDERRLEQALEATERTLEGRATALARSERAKAVAAIYDLLDRREPATAQRMERLIEALASTEAEGPERG